MLSSRLNWRCRPAGMMVVLFVTSMLFLPAISRAVQNGNKQPAAAPDLQVEFLGAEKGYATAGQSVTVLCVIRNTGGAPLPENSARVRCYPLSGLDFMDGQLWPFIPGLSPNQGVAYRWRLAMTDQTTPLVFSVLINKEAKSGPESDGNVPGGPRVAQTAPDAAIAPRLSVISIPRFPASPHLLGQFVAGRIPQASTTGNGAHVGNDRSLVNVLAAQDHVPVVVLACTNGVEWKNVALGTPCIQVRSSEEGQSPWWESFRWTDTDIQNTKDSAILTLIGNVGPNWSAHIVFESRLDTGVIYGKVRLTARRTVRVYGVQLPRLLASAPGGAGAVKADGSAEMLKSDPGPLADQDRLAAAHTGNLTYGITWPAAAPLTGWRSQRLPAGDEDHLPVLGAQWVGDERGDVILAGAAIEAPFRLFAVAPSDTVRDAARFRIP